jgi:signal peptidase I
LKSGSLLVNLAFLFLITITLGYFIFQATGLPSVVIVRGKSMEPTLIEGDIVFVVQKNPEKITIGDVVVFDFRGTSIVHRVVEKSFIEDTVGFTTKGDANPTTDQELGVPPLKPENVKGVLFSQKGSPLIMPRVGIVYVLGNEAVSYWTSGRISLLFPTIIMGLGVMIFLRGNKTKELNGFPFSRSKITKKTFATMILLTFIVIQIAFIPLVPSRIHSYNMRIGVETQPQSDADFNLGSIEPGKTKNITITLYAQSAIQIPSNGFAYIEGNASQLLSLPHPNIQITPDKKMTTIELAAYAPSNALKDNYTGKLIVYDRPELSIVPFEATDSILPNNMPKILIFDFIANLIVATFLISLQLSFLLVSNRLADTMIWNYNNFDWVGWKISSIGSKIKGTCNSSASRLRRKLKWKNLRETFRDITAESTYLPLHLIPIMVAFCLTSFFGNMLLGIVLCSIISPLYMVFIKKWVWKSDITMVSLMATIIASAFYMASWALINGFTQVIWSAFSLFPPFLFLSLTCLLITVPVSYLTSFIGLKWVARNPGKSLDTLGDFDVVP